MTCTRAVYILRCAGQRSRSQGHKIENAYSAIPNQLYTIFSVIFQRISAKYGLYIGSTSCINPVNFQVRTPNVKVTVRHKHKMRSVLQYANGQNSLKKAKTSLIHVPGRFDQELGWWKPTKAKDAQQCITLYTTIHHNMFYYYFRHTTDFIGQNTRGRSSHASLDINTTSNYCSVSLARVAQSVERRTPVWEAPGSNPKNTQLFFLFFWVHLLKVCSTQPKKPFKEKKKEKNSFNLSANSERYSNQELGRRTFQGHNKVWRQTSL